MIKINKSFSTEPRLCQVNLNFSINPETIPTLAPLKSLEIIQAGDMEPYYVTEEIKDINEPANGIIYTKEFWASYISKIKDAPFPGSKAGHTSPYEWWATGETDLYVIGGEIKENSVMLKMYIPPDGQSSSNARFIKNVKAGMVHFSIVAYTEDIMEIDENGNIKSIKAVRSVKGERNDAVERNTGAMDQKISKDKSGNNNPDKTKQEVYIMEESTYTDIIKNLNNQIANGTVSKLSIANDLKIEVLTADHKNAVKILKEITSIVGEDPAKVIREMKQNAKIVKQQAYDNIREKLMTEAFGPEKTNINGEKKSNLKRQAAEAYVKTDIQTEDKLKEQIKAAKENPVVLQFSFSEADVNSETNLITKTKDGDKAKHRTSEFIKI